MYTEQVAPPASAKHLLALGKMSEGQRVSKLLKGLSRPAKSQDTTLSTKFDKMQVFSAERKQSLHFKFHSADTVSR